MIHKSSFDAFLLHYGLKKEYVFEVHAKRLILDFSEGYICLWNVDTKACMVIWYFWNAKIDYQNSLNKLF